MSKPNSPRLVFHASIADVRSAIQRGGRREGMSVKFDIPESDVEAASPLWALPEVPLLITIEIDDDDPAPATQPADPPAEQSAPAARASLRQQAVRRNRQGDPGL